MVKKVFAWANYDNDELKLEKPKSISHKYDDGGAFRELYPIVKAESWLKSNQNWYYQKQGQLVEKDWVYDKGTWYFMNDQGSHVQSNLALSKVATGMPLKSSGSYDCE